MSAAISVSHLSKVYQSTKKQPGLSGTLRALIKPEFISVEAVKDISFEIESGEIVGFIGPNGAGKTTTLKMLSGILWPSSGQAQVLGHTPWKREHSFQRQFAIVLGSKNQLWWDLPARDTFLLNKEVYSLSQTTFEQRLNQLSHILEVEKKLDIPVRNLSLGERMKCELINALLHQPRVLFLDEPTIGLDVISQKAVRDFLREWNGREQTTIILTSHSMNDVQALCKRVLIIQEGSLHYDGPLDTLGRQMGDQKLLTIHFQESVTKRALAELGNILSFDATHVTLSVPRDEIQHVTKQALDSFAVADLSIEEVPIEEVIRTLFLKNRA